MSLFNRHWYGVQGFGTGVYPTLAVRVQTAKDGPWQSLNAAEIEQLLKEHNDAVRIGKKSAAGINQLPGRLRRTELPKVDQTPVRAAKKAAMEKLHGTKKEKKK